MPLQVLPQEALGGLAAAIERCFGSGLQAVIVIRRPAGPRWSSALHLPQPEEIVRPVASRILDLARIPHALSGRGHLEEALCLLGAVYPKRPQMSKQIYPAIAARRGTTPDGVDRAIRYALRVAADKDRAAAAAVLGEAGRQSPAAVLFRLVALVESDLAQGAVP